MRLLRYTLVWLLVAGLFAPQAALPLGGGGSGQISAAQRTTLVNLRAALATAQASNPVTNPPMASPPTITQSTTPDAALANVVNYATNPTAYSVSGGNAYVQNSNGMLYVATDNFSPGTSGNIGAIVGSTTATTPNLLNLGENENLYTVGLHTAAPVMQCRMTVSSANVPYRFIDNNQYVSTAGTITTSQYVEFNNGSTPIGDFTIEIQLGQGFAGCAVASGYTITKQAIANPVALIATGDSYCEAEIGFYPPVYMAMDGVFSTMSKLVGFSNYQNACVGGTGYWNASGGNPGTRLDINGQMAYWPGSATAPTAPLPNAAAFAGGYNDKGVNPNSDTAARALADWKLARSMYPDALIIVFGVWGGPTGPNLATVSLEQALQKQFFAWADPFSMFIQVSTSADPVPTTATLCGAAYPTFCSGTYQYGTGNTGAIAGNGNADVFIAPALHPNDPGHLNMGTRAATDFINQLARFNFLLKRDIDPAGNDNDPMWLEKAA